ncbi:thiopurine S-methyltransferase [Hydrogenovibrio sp. 3SP14C1]|uniref:thiopurine S-methyltransferase n=1 Tax=Hydrogenovibrio sp. 3SP14C1 TaxID=3038774 RepID=UPI002416F5A0|nr:thiopurine S-methyltransferase [Hydrogenovibrio sp. 3SP14C1]MDG4812326.1 thiopurine S-methyltransferase [Hydrogenovibrio sp. 3SP14C1]
MEADFWHQMWRSGRVGFHQSNVNAFLATYWEKLNLEGHEQVLVPLCGKSLDMLWLSQQGHAVLGVELNKPALQAFLSEHNLQATSIQHPLFSGYEVEDMTLLCGDFFDLSAEDCASVKAVYDRAALVALPLKMRQQYAMHLKTILAPDVPIFLIAMDYDQSLQSGPPFAVSESEVKDLFGDMFDIEKIDSEIFERKGVQTTESVFVLTSKS